MTGCWMLLVSAGEAAEAPKDLSVPWSTRADHPAGRHPGQNGPLTPDQEALVLGAWSYFENNTQPSCLVNSVDGYPSTTLWDTASGVAAVVSAFEFGLIDPASFDGRISCVLETLARLPLYRGELPNKAYDTIGVLQVDYANQPASIGFSAIDLGRMLIWLAIVKARYPLHSEAVDRVVLKWNFCNLIDDAGTLYGGANTPDGGVVYLQEGRLGYEEYAAAGFQLWGFDTTAASRPQPFAKTRIEGVSIAHDARDPKEFGAHTYVVTEAYLLAGLELNWDRVNESPESDLWTSDRVTRKHGQRVYRAQVARWRNTGILTARTEHHVDEAPWFVYDTVYSDGVAWNTISDDGRQHPALAALSSKAAVGMSVLYDTPYTDRLMASVMPLLDPERGLREGRYEESGLPIEAFTANTNGIVLETLLYKVQGKLYRDPGFGFETLWDHTPNGEFPGNWQCLPRASKAKVAPERGRKLQSVQADAAVSPPPARDQ